MATARHYRGSHPEQLFREAEQYEETGDFKRAFKCLLAAAELGYAMSQINLGNFYAAGKGVGRNLKKAAHWYKQAYKNGYSTGALNLAIDRRNVGNVRSAVVWLKRAIAMNDGAAYIALAKIYNARKGGQKTAAGLLRRALRLSRDDISDSGKKEARSLLREIGRKAHPGT